jgi:hypothetical protein
MNNITSSFSNFATNIDNAFFFVIDKIVDLQNYFIGVAKSIGYVVILIAVLSAALNYALNGTGLKENMIKIMKATLFFFIVIFSYPKIIGWITSYTFTLAEKSIGDSVKKYFDEVEETVTNDMISQVNISSMDNHGGNNTFTFTRKIVTEFTRDRERLFSDIFKSRNHPQMPYTTISPANSIKIVFFLAGDCMTWADVKDYKVFPVFSRVLKGLVCGFFLIFTGIFAVMEYCVCFLEFMLVSSVGVILFPLSLWEGSKFMAEKYIGAIIGFFMKLLFCTLAIYLMLYGFISLFYIIHKSGFDGQPDQITFIAFTSLLFFFICKSAPALAQSLLTGSPNLSAAGAIGAVSGAVGAAASVAGYAQRTGGAVTKAVAGGLAKGGVAAFESLASADAAADAVQAAGGTRFHQAGAWFNSMGQSAKDSAKAGALGLTRSLLGEGKGSNPHSWRESFLTKTDQNGEY